MRKVALFSLLLIIGLVGSQLLPLLGPDFFLPVAETVNVLTLVGLAFIMIHVGYEFEIDKGRMKAYGQDYVVAMTAAAFPWIFVALYFVWVMLPQDLWGTWKAWKEILLVSRFAAPTSAGVLFSMLAAGGLSATWLFRKARILAIFDDLDTVLLMIPLTMMIIGPAWQLIVVVFVMVVLLWLAWRFMHEWRIPASWPWVVLYALAIVGATEGFYHLTKKLGQVPIHIEVLLPAFVLGCMMRRPAGTNPHVDDTRPGHQEGPENPSEQRASTIISGAFMLLVGLNMPPIFVAVDVAKTALGGSITAQQPMLGPGAIALHVILVTLLSNAGKMYPALVYRGEAHWKERLATAMAMWPRGEVGAGVVVVGLKYGVGGPIVTVAVLSLAVNLLLTGVFIWLVKRLLQGVPREWSTRLPSGAGFSGEP
jgi:Kef-type K+ transport system membrane component KefB